MLGHGPHPVSSGTSQKAWRDYHTGSGPFLKGDLQFDCSLTQIPHLSMVRCGTLYILYLLYIPVSVTLED